MMKWICVILLLLSLKSIAQYPFEKYPAIKYKKVTLMRTKNKHDSTYSWVGDYKDYTVALAEYYDKHRGNVILYYKGKVIKKIAEDVEISALTLTDKSLYVADIDHNGLIDFKLCVYNNGSGLAGSLEKKIYLFNQGNNKSHKISFMDFFSNAERDLDGDHKFEIIGQHYLSYLNHAYWVFDLYSYENGRLVNVSRRFNYPILTRFLNSKDEHTVTTMMSRRKMRQFSVKYPRDYSLDTLPNALK